MTRDRSFSTSTHATARTEGSGVLPVAMRTHKVGLAWRSRFVDAGQRWGTIGGRITDGLSPEANAVRELQEETGYAGEVILHAAYVFSNHECDYYNFICVVPDEFGLAAASEYSWETDRLEWFPWETVLDMAASEPDCFHYGLLALLGHSKTLIESIIQDISKTDRPVW